MLSTLCTAFAYGRYVVEVVYSRKPVQANVDSSFCVAIDPGVTNLAAITANRVGFIPPTECATCTTFRHRLLKVV